MIVSYCSYYYITTHVVHLSLIVVVICKCKKNYYSSDCFYGSKIDFCIAFSTHNHYTPINVYTEKMKSNPTPQSKMLPSLLTQNLL